jgi:hypothetical protein
MSGYKSEYEPLVLRVAGLMIESLTCVVVSPLSCSSCSEQNRFRASHDIPRRDIDELETGAAAAADAGSSAFFSSAGAAAAAGLGSSAFFSSAGAAASQLPLAPFNLNYTAELRYDLERNLTKMTDLD